MPTADSVVTRRVLTPPTRAGRAGRATRAGRSYRILRTAEVDPYDQPVAAADVLVFAAAPPADSFRGTARRAAKISIADAPVEPFGDLPALLASLPPDQQMTSRQPSISEGSRSNRVAEEKRNVRVRAFLYAASREDDNDFHLIVGSAPGTGPLRCMTMELSGLPPARNRSHARLKQTRDAFKAFFGTDLPGSSYDFYEPPIPVEIEGALFFDISHATGPRPGPDSLRPFIPTIWEVHPITRIVFEP
jgi:hypothetical protein